MFYKYWGVFMIRRDFDLEEMKYFLHLVGSEYR